jgi:ribosomal protein S18 acetylase RimI-like enzyme
MQIREITLTELDIAYEVLQELRTDLTYNDFENLVYEMRHQEYKMYGIFMGEELVTYAGVSVQVNLYWRRHLYVYDLVTYSSMRSKGYGKAMLDYLIDIAKMNQCESVVLSSGNHRTDAHRFYEQQGFETTSRVFIKPV